MSAAWDPGFHAMDTAVVRWAAPLRPFLHGVDWRRGGLRVLRITAAVLGFFSFQGFNRPDDYPHRSGWTVVFRKAPPANSTGRLMLGDCWIGWYSIVRTRVFSLTVWFQRERFEALPAVNIMEHAFSFHGAGGE